MKITNVALGICAIAGITLIVHGVLADDAPNQVKTFDEASIVFKELQYRIEFMGRELNDKINLVLQIGGGTILLIAAGGGWLITKLLEVARSQAKIESMILEIYHSLRRSGRIATDSEGTAS